MKLVDNASLCYNHQSSVFLVSNTTLNKKSHILTIFNYVISSMSLSVTGIWEIRILKGKAEEIKCWQCIDVICLDALGLLIFVKSAPLSNNTKLISWLCGKPKFLRLCIYSPLWNFIFAIFLNRHGPPSTTCYLKICRGLHISWRRRSLCCFFFFFLCICFAYSFM